MARPGIPPQALEGSVKLPVRVARSEILGPSTETRYLDGNALNYFQRLGRLGETSLQVPESSLLGHKLKLKFWMVRPGIHSQDLEGSARLPSGFQEGSFCTTS